MTPVGQGRGVFADEWRTRRSRGCTSSRTSSVSSTTEAALETGVDEANLEGATPVEVSVGSHDGYRVEAQNGVAGSCAVLLAVSDSSYVDISSTASGGKDTAKACDVATDVARIVEPKLP